MKRVWWLRCRPISVKFCVIIFYVLFGGEGAVVTASQKTYDGQTFCDGIVVYDQLMATQGVERIRWRLAASDVPNSAHVRKPLCTVIRRVKWPPVKPRLTCSVPKTYWRWVRPFCSWYCTRCMHRWLNWPWTLEPCMALRAIVLIVTADEDSDEHRCSKSTNRPRCSSCRRRCIMGIDGVIGAM